VVSLTPAVIAVLLLSSTASALETNTNCSSLQTYADCSPHLHCEWCGNERDSLWDLFLSSLVLHCEWCGNESQSYPDSACYERGAGLSCCSAKQTNDMCFNSVQICTESQTCYQEPSDTGFGLCLVPMCCGDPTPTPCTPTCIAADGVCCGGGLSCNAGQSCCGGEEVGFACCDEGASCCSTPDGYDHWCCPANQQCNINGGC
ncbi:Hypothetical protein, putative, partial [Bodo saltans]